ncbi:hypothetical protein Tco_1248324 [Tanacetum coccineum]
MEAYITLMQPTQLNKITSSCEICSGPHDTQYCMENPKQAFVEYASSRTDGTRSRNPAVKMNFTSTNDPAREELQGKRIKSPSKLLSPKYCLEDEAKEEGNVNSSTTEYEDHKMTVESEEDSLEEETEMESKEEEEDSPKHFDTFLTMKELRYLALEKPSTPMGKGQG